jgi:hypothetical protein
MFDSYTNRMGKGTHRALDRLQQFARRFSYVLRLDVVQHFASMGLLKKAASGVLAIFPCSRITHTLRA